MKQRTAYEVHLNGTRVARFVEPWHEGELAGESTEAARARIRIRQLKRMHRGAQIVLVKDTEMEVAASDLD